MKSTVLDVTIRPFSFDIIMNRLVKVNNCTFGLNIKLYSSHLVLL